jgi:hypothetical protein
MIRSALIKLAAASTSCCRKKQVATSIDKIMPFKVDSTNRSNVTEQKREDLLKPPKKMV